MINVFLNKPHMIVQVSLLSKMKYKTMTLEGHNNQEKKETKKKL